MLLTKAAVVSSNDFGFHTDDLTDPADWWQWVIRNHGDLISQSATRLGAAVISGALGLAAAQMFASGSKLAKPTLAAAGVFAAGFAGSAALDARSRRQVKP